MPKVGIFFIDDVILTDAVPVDNSEPYGDAIQHGSHYEFWGSLVPRTITERKFRARAYDAYPRGRVVYFPKKKKFCVYHDACLKSNAEFSRVVENFKLNVLDIEFANDEHYKCAGCNPYFLD